MQLLRSLSDEPEINCALEASLLTQRREVLLFYINRPSVIIGRNQCAAAEVDTAYCRQHDIRVVRRMSGGGAVYHDHGNVNYAFICNRQATTPLDVDYATPVAAALQSLFGLDVTVGRRKELLAGGRKISGTASHVVRNRILFHGTLLYSTHLEHLDRALQGDTSLRGRCVASVPAPVANIATLTGSTATTAAFLDMLTAFFDDSAVPEQQFMYK